MPDEGVPLEHYVRNKFGDAAGQRFLSGDSPVAQSGKAAVCIAYYYAPVIMKLIDKVDIASQCSCLFSFRV